MRELSQPPLEGERAASGFVREQRAAESCQYRRGAETRRPRGARPEYQRAERTDKRADKKKKQLDSGSQRVSGSRWLVGFLPQLWSDPPAPTTGMQGSEADASHRRSATRVVSGVVCTPPAIRLYRNLCLDDRRRTGEAAADTFCRLREKIIRKKTQSTGQPDCRKLTLTLSKHVAADASRPSMHYALQPTDLGDGDSRLSG